MVKYQCQFVAALEDAELLCTIVSDTGTGTITLPQASLQICTMTVFVVALEDAELLCTVQVR